MNFVNRNVNSKTFWTAVVTVATLWQQYAAEGVDLNAAILGTLGALLVLFNRDTTAKAEKK